LLDGADRGQVVVLEHDHGGGVVAVRVGASHHERVLLDQAEARRRLAAAGQDTVPVHAVQHLAHPPGRRRHSAGTRKAVEQHALSQQHAPGLAAHLQRPAHHVILGRRAYLGHLGDRVQPLALVAQPLDVAVEPGEDGVGKGHPGQHAGALAPQVGQAVRLAHHQQAHVQAGLVLGQPGEGQTLQHRRVQQGLHPSSRATGPRA
ncbi:unnamed protein product, partial [Ixodes persulcatus]